MNQGSIFDPMAVFSIPKRTNGSDLNIAAHKIQKLTPNGSPFFFFFFFVNISRSVKDQRLRFDMAVALSFLKSLYSSDYSLWPYNWQKNEKELKISRPGLISKIYV